MQFDNVEKKFYECQSGHEMFIKDIMYTVYEFCLNSSIINQFNELCCLQSMLCFVMYMYFYFCDQ